MVFGLLSLVFVFFPILVIYSCYKYPLVDKLGAVVICYIAGIILGNTGLLPDGFAKVQESITNLSVIIALPILLFSLDVKKWTRHSGKAILSIFLATFSIIIVASIGFLIVNDSVNDAWKLVGMAIGLYTGGTPNLAAIKTALDIDPTLYLTFHTYDVLVGSVYIIFCITIAQRIFGKFLPAFDSKKGDSEDIPVTDYEREEINSYQGILKWSIIKGLIVSLVLSLIVVGLSFGVGQLFPDEYLTSIIILMVTTFGIAFSFVPFVKNIEKTFQFGMYIILIFCLTVGAMADLEKIFVTVNYDILFFVLGSVFGSMILHALLCKLFNIDTDTFIVTSVSAIGSPPFVPLVADALKNKQVVLSGMTAGIIGYAIGNYIGVSMAYLMKSIM
ncbi:DUF819 family protein [bacterium]|nr:DUF819 family protein [bacterium]